MPVAKKMQFIGKKSSWHVQSLFRQVTIGQKRQFLFKSIFESIANEIGRKKDGHSNRRTAYAMCGRRPIWSGSEKIMRNKSKSEEETMAVVIHSEILEKERG